MSEFFKVLMNVHSLRAALRELSLEQVKEAHEKIELVYAYSHAWRSLNNIHADHSITSMPITQ